MRMSAEAKDRLLDTSKYKVEVCAILIKDRKSSSINILRP